MKQTLILLGLAAGVICNSGIKHRLGQVKAKTLAEQESCSCAIPLGALDGVTGAALSQGSYNSFANGASVSQGVTVQTIPDVAQTENVITEECECSQNSQQSAAAGNVGKHYEVAGAIQVSEEVSYTQTGSFSASGSAASHKQAACVVNNVNGTSSGSGVGQCASVCSTGSGSATIHI